MSWWRNDAAWVALWAVMLVGCGGPIDIERASYGGSCGAPLDVTGAVADSCSKDGCSCDKACFGRDGDPAPGCAKDLEVAYSFEGGATETITCGPVQDETYVFTVSSDGEASCVAGPASCIKAGNACGPADAANAACCSGYCDVNGVCDL